MQRLWCWLLDHLTLQHACALAGGDGVDQSGRWTGPGLAGAWKLDRPKAISAQALSLVDRCHWQGSDGWLWQAGISSVAHTHAC